MIKRNIFLLFLGVFVAGIIFFTLIFYLFSVNPDSSSIQLDTEPQMEQEGFTNYQLNESPKTNDGVAPNQGTVKLVFPTDYMLINNEVPQTYLDGAKILPPSFDNGGVDGINWWWGEQLGLPISLVDEIYFMEYYGFGGAGEEELLVVFVKFVSPTTLTNNLADLVTALRRDPSQTPVFAFKDDASVVIFVESKGNNTSLLQSGLNKYSERLGLEKIPI